MLLFLSVRFWLLLIGFIWRGMLTRSFPGFLFVHAQRMDVHPFLSQNIFSSMAFLMLSVYMFVLFTVSVASSHVQRKESNTLNTVTSLHQSSELFLLLTWL